MRMARAQGAADDQVSDLQARMTNCRIVYERCGPRAALSLLRRRSIIPTIPLRPTLETGVEALRVGAHAWLSRKAP